MSLQIRDIEEIESLLQSGLSVLAIADKYDVPESTMRYFINSHKLEKPNARKVRNNSQHSQQFATIRNNSQQFSGFESPVMPLYQPSTNQAHSIIPVPNSSDPQVLNYLLQLKTIEAQSSSNRMHELELENRRLKETLTDFEIKQKHFDREKELAVEDAIRGKGSFNAEKALTMLNNNPPLSTALAGIITKLANVDGGASQLGGIGMSNNSNLNELVKYLLTKDEKTITEVVSVAFILADDPNWRAECFQIVKSKSTQM